MEQAASLGDDMMARFLHWIDESYMTAHGNVFDIRIAMREALVKYAKSIPPLECGVIGIYDNGSLMRILPMALYLHQVMGPEFPSKPKVSALTHAHPISLITCGLYCAAANDLLCQNQGSAAADMWFILWGRHCGACFTLTATKPAC